MKKKYNCPICRSAIYGTETVCPNCGNALTPVIRASSQGKAKKEKDPEKKKKAKIKLAIVFGSLFVLAVLVLWYFRIWPFRPRIDSTAITAGIGSPEEFLNLTEIPAPSDEQKAALAKYVDKLMVQQKHRLDFTDRSGAKKIQILASEITKDSPDLEKLIRDLGGEITYESEKSGMSEPAVRQTGAKLPQSPLSGMRLTGSLSAIGRSSFEREEADDAEENPEGEEAGEPEENPEPEDEESVVPDGVDNEGVGSDEELVTTLPQEQLHSARLKIGFGAEKLTCPACGHKNPKDAEFCEECGTRLQASPNYVEDETIEQEPIIIAGGGSGLDETQREALMLSNLSNVLLMSNRSTLGFYLACLACQEDPESVNAVVSLVTHLRMHGFLEEALDVCVVGLQMDPYREELYIHAGNIYIQLDKPDAALGYFGRCLQMCGFSGPAYQGMMAAHLQQKDYIEAYRCMIEGARDGYVSGIRLVYDMLKLRGDYWEIAGAVFKNYSVRTLMDFSVNRSGFNPGQELEGKVVDIGACRIPSSPEDWVASAETMLRGGQRYAKDLVEYYKEDLKELAEIYNILLNANDLKDLASGFISVLGDKYKKEKLTEAERVISYEQEVFWLEILDDYREWKVKDIREKVDKELDGSDMEQLFGMMGNILEENKAFLEAHDGGSLEDIAAVLGWTFERVEGNQSIAFTSDQSAVIVSKIKNALRENGNVRNRAYQEIGEVLHDYYMYSNALLSMVADKELYREWRQKIVMNVVGDQAVCIAECCFMAYVCPILAEPYLMIGQQTQEGFLEGAITGKNTPFPKFIISNKPVRPSADLDQDIYIPDINSISRKVLGVDEVNSDDPKNEFLALRRIWEMNWMDTHPGVPKSEMPQCPNFNDSYQREKFWNGLTPDKRAMYQAILTDPDVLKKTVQLDMYCGAGQTVTMFKEENIGWLNGMNVSVSEMEGKIGVTANADGSMEGKVKLGKVGEAKFDTNGNLKVTMKNKKGVNLGVAKTGRDLTAFFGWSADLLEDGKDEGLQGSDYNGQGHTGASVSSSATGSFGVNAQVYGTYSLAKGQITSGGAKGGFGVGLLGIIGAGVETNYNVVQGISTTSYYYILAGKKHSIIFKSNNNSPEKNDKVEKKNVPGLQEFHR